MNTEREELSIVDSKILKLNLKNVEIYEQHKKVLYIAENVIDILQKLNLENFPHAIMIVVDVHETFFDTISRVILSKFCTKTQEIFVQAFLVNQLTSKFYHKLKDESSFQEFAVTSKIKLLKPRIKSLLGLPTLEIFFELLVQLKTRVINVDFNEIIKFLQLEINPKELIKNSIATKNLNLINILMLFVTDLSKDFLIKTLNANDEKILILVLSNFNLEEIDDELIERILVNGNISKILNSVIKENSLESLKILTKNSELVQNFVNFDLWRELRKIALDNNFHACLFELQKMEKKFYQPNFDVKYFYRNILTGNLNEIQKLVKLFPDFKILFCDFQTCALEKAIIFRQYEIYSFLLSEIFLALDEMRLNERISCLADDAKGKIQKYNLRFSKKNPENYINILCTKCDLHGCSSSMSHQEIREMIQKLSKNADIKSFLETVASTSIQLIFDFNTPSVQSADPNCHEHTMGIFYPDHSLVYVGKNKNKTEQAATFIHELTHYIFYFFYQNDAKPFLRGDSVREDEWHAAFLATRFKYCQNPHDTDPIIKWVFESYPPEMQEAELAVRPNHIIVRYLNEPEILTRLRNTYNELFDYYEKILLDLRARNVIKLLQFTNNFSLYRQAQLETVRFQHLFKKCFYLSLQNNEDTKVDNFISNRQTLPILRSKSKRILIASNVPEMTIQSIACEIFAMYENKLNSKLENIFVNSEKINRDVLNFKIVENLNIQRIFLVIKNFDFECIKFLTEFPRFVQIFFICLPKLCKNILAEFNFEAHQVQHEWKELSKKSQKDILSKNCRFQEKVFKISELLTNNENLSDEIFAVLCSEKEIIINQFKNMKISNFITRKIEKKNYCVAIEDAEEKQNMFCYEEKSLEEFMESVENVQILLLSDMAGSGKTTFLCKVHQILLEKFSQHFILFVGLKDHVDELFKSDFTSFQDFMIKILSFNQLEAEIFTQKFAKGEVKILFDAFDEISPKCKEETLKLFKLFKEQENNQIWITTRTHLEHDLERELDVLAYKLKILDKSEQIEFLKVIWKNSHSNKELIQECAVKMVEKISEMISTNPSVIGVPLIVEGLANYFQKKIDENFQEIIENLKIFQVYEKIIIEASFKILRFRFPEKVEEHLNKSDSILKVHQYLAIVHLFNEDFALDLGLNYDEDEWTLEEISRGGIINYDKDKKTKFNHETYAENLIAKVLFDILKNSRKPTKFQVNFFQEIMTMEKFEITRKFLDDMLENFKNTKFKILESCKKVIENFTSNFLLLTARENLINIFEFTLKLFEIEKSKSIRKILVAPSLITGKSVLMDILPKIKDKEIFANSFSKIFDFYGDKIFDEFLLLTDNEGSTILHHMTSVENEANNFSFFTAKISKTFCETDNFKKFIFLRNTKNKTFLHMLNFCLRKDVEKVERIFEFIKILPEHKQIELISLRDDDNQNILCKSVYHDEKVFFTIFKFIENLLSNEDLNSLMKETNEKNKDNLFHLASYVTKSCEVLKFLCETISPFDKEFFLLEGNSEKNVLYLSAINPNNPQIFPFILEMAKKICNQNDEEVKMLILRQNSDRNNVLTCATNRGPKSTLEFLFTKVFNESEMKNLLKTQKCFANKNLLALVSENQNKGSTEYIWTLYEENLNRKEFLKILEEKDEQGTNFFHPAVRFAPLSNVKFLFEKILTFYTKSEVETFLRKTQDNFLRNLLSCAALNLNSDSIEYLWSIFHERLDREAIIELLYEKDSYEHNTLHAAGYFSGSRKIFEIMWTQIKNTLRDEDKIREYSMIKGIHQRNILLISIRNRKNIFSYILENIFFKLFDFKDFIYECEDDGENFFHYLARFGSVAMLEFAFKMLSEKLKQEFKNFLKIKTSRKKIFCIALPHRILMKIHSNFFSKRSRKI